MDMEKHIMGFFIFMVSMLWSIWIVFVFFIWESKHQFNDKLTQQYDMLQEIETWAIQYEIKTTIQYDHKEFK
jgi:hypothetical protein